jgi:NADH:ubiquinone oxidoreductase subunit F (NADH-binding)/NADH:ubiquinone oxidoreductase subunit E/Pyruvate/2-oxoacid:ferredoxin oxidoreductase delta subunit/(2Fe-2S) ferredoxin
VTRARWIAIGRAWLGLAAAAVALASAVWLVSEYVYARYVTPIETVRVAELREKAKTDAEVQKILKPEWDRQHEELVRRRNAYRYGGLALLVAVGVFFAWMRWLRPPEGQWLGVPPRLVRTLGKARDRPAPAAVSMACAGGDATPSPGPPGIDLSPLLRHHRAEDRAVEPGAIDAILLSAGTRRDSLLPVLQAVQARYRYLPDAALRRVCEASAITPAQAAGVATFYGQFRLTPAGAHIIRVCEGTACHVAGAVEVRTELRRCLGMTDGGDTDPTGTFTVERVACIGSCSLAPVITIDDQIYGHLTALSVSGALRQFIDRAVALGGNGHRRSPTALATLHPHVPERGAPPVEIRIGSGTCGRAAGADAVHAALHETVAAFGGGAVVKAVGCSGLCHHEPLVEVVAHGRRVLYGNVEAHDVRALVRRHVPPAGLLRKVREEARDVRARLVDDRAWTPIASRAVDAAPYLGKQVRIVLENCGEVDPLRLDEYRQRGGMRALEACLAHLTPEEVIDHVRRSGLRGRGGAGFPTAAKWGVTRQSAGSPKYVICNADEGDPGAFMDRAVLESDPFRVIEGLAIAAYAVGATEGIIYVRSEYPIAVRHARAAIAAAEAHGMLGDRILGSPFSFKAQVREGAGAFVCGEETALIQSLEGERGMPRLRPPYPAVSGLWGKPTLINNVETLACLPWIFRHGPDSFAALGTAASKGTKVFSLTGKVKRSGLIEVPMGITIREIVEGIGGGVPEGRQFKAVLAGGPSGGCIPARLADTPVDFEALASTGAIMGSGGLVVLDNRDCAVEIARYFLQFTQNESCGKCTYCRVGTKRMLEILERICKGRGVEGDIETLDELSARVKTGSLCGLGQTAPNPVLTTLRYFREEYEAHVRERRCPAAVCKALIRYRVLDNCTGCTLCAQACPAGAIVARPYVRHEVADDLCTRCGMCVTACPEDAIEVA